MKILLTGGTGFIGCELVKHLVGHQITILTRTPKQAQQKLRHADFSNIEYITSIANFSDLNPFDAVINLAGEPIAERRWTPTQKEQICSSRWNITQQIVDLIRHSESPPTCLISGSAVGIYGDKGHQHVYENSSLAESGFPANVCKKWEHIANQAQSERTRVCTIRTGIVLGAHGGALKTMLPAFKLGVGAKLGHGEQYTPWIHIQDQVRGIIYLLQKTKVSGAFNFTAPHPVTNKDFSKTLAKTLNRPCLFSAPKWLMDRSMGESAQLVFDSVRAKPKHLTEIGFIFTFSHLEPALKQILHVEKN